MAALRRFGELDRTVIATDLRQRLHGRPAQPLRQAVVLRRLGAHPDHPCAAPGSLAGRTLATPITNPDLAVTIAAAGQRRDRPVRVDGVNLMPLAEPACASQRSCPSRPTRSRADASASTPASGTATSPTSVHQVRLRGAL